MIKLKFLENSKVAVWLALVLAVSVSGWGCGTTPAPRTAAPETAGAAVENPTENRLRVGDIIEIRLVTSSSHTGGQASAEIIPAVVDENGEISLPLIERIKAGGSTPSELSERIQANYVPRYYVRCNVTVQVAARFFYVGGEVRASGRYAWSEDVTLLKAINMAGSFTDYANRAKVEIIRGKEKTTENAEHIRQNPTRDVPIRPGDSIWVPRSMF